MSSTDQPYKGFKSFKMDPKFRVSIQPSWRPEGGGLLFLMLSTDHKLPVVKVLSQAGYDERVETIKTSDLSAGDKIKMLGRLAMLNREASLNDQGKLLVPKDLSEKAGILAESEVVLVGRGLHFEIWSKENFDAMFDLETNAEDADVLGIF